MLYVISAVNVALGPRNIHLTPPFWVHVWEFTYQKTKSSNWLWVIGMLIICGTPNAWACDILWQYYVLDVHVRYFLLHLDLPCHCAGEDVLNVTLQMGNPENAFHPLLRFCQAYPLSEKQKCCKAKMCIYKLLCGSFVSIHSQAGFEASSDSGCIFSQINKKPRHFDPVL